MTWSVLAASTAGWAVRTLANLAGGTAWKERVEPAFKRSGLDHELARAYEAAFKGFVDVLRGPFLVDDAMDARLREMFADDGFLAILAELPRARFDDVDTTRARLLFAGLGLPGAGDSHFDFAWATFGRVFGDQVARTRHAAKLAELSRQDRIESYLAKLAAGARPRDEPAALAAYRRFVEDLYRLADTRGLFWREKQTTGEEIHLAEVFVETLLRRRSPSYEHDLAKVEEQRSLARRAAAADREPVADEERRLRNGGVREGPRTVAEVLAKERRLVILGPPGSGKSTLARCLALALSADDPTRRPLAVGLPEQTVPILLALKTYAARLKGNATLKLDAFLAEEVDSQLPGLAEVLAGGGALVLLDGLDEVFDEQHRRWVSAEVARLMSLYPQTRFVLTSRPHGYRAAPLPGAVPLYDMVPFDHERIRAFFRGWFTALARQGLEVEHGRTPEQRAEALAGDVLGRPRIRSLAENPMLCTMIVLVHRSRSGRLPERRVKFYQAAVAVLTEHWEKAKHSPKQEARLDYPEPELMVGVLAEVAWKAQTELKSREIPAPVLETWIEGALAEDAEWSGKRKSAARDLLQVIQGRTGLLVDAGGEHYQFVHLSLQEYLVAFYLLDRLDDAQCCRVARHFVHAPQWQEILRLTIGAAPRVRADTLVRALLAEPTSEWEAISRRDLRFVCRSMADRPSVSEAVLADARSRWLEILRHRSYDDETGLIRDGVGLGLTPETRLAVEARLADENWSVRRSAVDYFAKIGADDEATRAAVEPRLADEDWIVRQSAVDFLAKIGAGDQATRAAIETRLADEHWIVRQRAVAYFAKIGANDEATRAAVETRLADEHPRVRQSAVRYFAEIGAGDEATRAAIETRLADENWIVRQSAVAYFAKIGANDQATRAAIEARLVDDRITVREAALRYFVETGLGDQLAAVLDALKGGTAMRIPEQTVRKLSTAIGRAAAEDDALLKRIIEERIPRFYRSLAFAAAAAHRDEIRRESTPLAEVLAGTAAQFQPPAEPRSVLKRPLSIARLVVDHLRVFDHLELHLGPGHAPAGQWTLLLGDNAVGKTTLLRAIALACIGQQTAAALLELTGITAPFVRHQAPEASLTLWTSAGEEIRCSITPNATSERLIRYGPVLPGTVFAYGCQRGTAFGGPMRDVELRPIDRVATLFADNAHLIHAETWLQEASLAAVKAGGARAAFYDAIRSTLVAVLPGVETLDFDDQARLWLDGPEIGRSPLAAMSDGYVTTVGWIVDLIARWAELNRRLGVELDGDFRDRMTGLVLIDEIDLHLHPLWQTEIVSTLRRQFPKMSFVATTHNPLTLVGAGPGEIHILRRDTGSGQVSARQQDIPPGTSADDVLTGEWFGLVSTLDADTQNLLDHHRGMLRAGVAVEDAERQALEKTLRQRLGTFPATSLDRMVQSIAAELMEGDFRRKTPEERRRIRQQLLERARRAKAELGP